MVRAQNNLYKANKWSEKTVCYLPGKKVHRFIQKSLLNYINTGRRTAVQATTTEQGLRFVIF